MSGFIGLNWRDVVKGLVMAVLTPVVLYFYDLIMVPDFSFDMVNVHKLAILGSAAGLAYIIKNILTTKEGKFLGTV